MRTAYYYGSQFFYGVAIGMVFVPLYIAVTLEDLVFDIDMEREHDRR